MYEYIEGTLAEITPTHLVLASGGIGYHIHISLYGYSRLTEAPAGGKTVRIFIHQIIREDVHMLYGFPDTKERNIFRHLISVSGIGAGTARMILSSLSPGEVEQAIMRADVNLLKAIKGIGIKSAQRIIVDLKDKLGKGVETDQIFSPESNTKREEALSALVTLGFQKGATLKVIDKLLTESPERSVEEIIKLALNRL